MIQDCFVVLSYQSFQAQYSTKAAGTQAVQAFPCRAKPLSSRRLTELQPDGKCNMMDTAPKKGFDLTVTDPADVTGFLRYMLEAGRTERVAG